MGLYIKGMEMPKKCNGCPLNFVGHCMAYNGYYVGRESLEYNSKPNWCPLVPIPPHGRLIDADALFGVMAIEYKRIAETYGKNDEYALCLKNYAISMVTNAPTVIPAEEGEA